MKHLRKLFTKFLKNQTRRIDLCKKKNFFIEEIAFAFLFENIFFSLFDKKKGKIEEFSFKFSFLIHA